MSDENGGPRGTPLHPIERQAAVDLLRRMAEADDDELPEAARGRQETFEKLSRLVRRAGAREINLTLAATAAALKIDTFEELVGLARIGKLAVKAYNRGHIEKLAHTELGEILDRLAGGDDPDLEVLT